MTDVRGRVGGRPADVHADLAGDDRLERHLLRRIESCRRNGVTDSFVALVRSNFQSNTPGVRDTAAFVSALAQGAASSPLAGSPRFHTSSSPLVIARSRRPSGAIATLRTNGRAATTAFGCSGSRGCAIVQRSPAVGSNTSSAPFGASEPTSEPSSANEAPVKGSATGVASPFGFASAITAPPS